MAAQRPKDQAVKWKPGALCEVFDREQRKWNEGEVISSFSDDRGEWVKVRCGQSVHELLCDDPYLRVSSSDNMLISVVKMKTLQSALHGTDFDRTLQWILGSSTKQLTSYDR